MFRKRVRLLAVVAACVVLVAACNWRGAAPTATSPGADGEFEVANIAVGEGHGFGGGTIWYPTDDTQSYGGVAISPGFRSGESAIAWWGQRLASHGFVVITIDTLIATDGANLRGQQLLAALDYLTGESDAAGRVDAQRLAVMGHSMGGGGAIAAADERPALRASVPLAAWHLTKEWDSVTVPTMFISCQEDTTAPNILHSKVFYDSISSDEKAYLEIADGGHSCARVDSALGSTAAVSWLKRYVDDDTRYSKFLCPAPVPGRAR